MAPQSSKTRLPEPFKDRNDFQTYVTHFEFLPQLQKGQIKETVDGDETKKDERPLYFVLRLQKSTIVFYQTLLEGTRKSHEETVKAFRQHYNEKLVIFRGRLARRVQQPRENLTDFLGNLKT